MQWQIKKVQTPTPRILAIIGLLITTKLSDFLHAIVSEGGGWGGKQLLNTFIDGKNKSFDTLAYL